MNSEIHASNSNQTIYKKFSEALDKLFDPNSKASLQTGIKALEENLTKLEQGSAGNFDGLKHALNIIQKKYGNLGSLQQIAEDKLKKEIENTNEIINKIGKSNTVIKELKLLDQPASIAIEQRNKFIEELSQKFNFDLSEQADGTVDLQIKGGFTIIQGSNVKNIELSTKPSFAEEPIPNIAGEPLSYVVYDYSSGMGTGHINLTERFAKSGGSLGALLSLRGYANNKSTNAFNVSGTLPAYAERIESLTRAMHDEFNLNLKDAKLPEIFEKNNITNKSQPITVGLSINEKLLEHREEFKNLKLSNILNKKLSFGGLSSYSFSGNIKAQINEISSSAKQLNNTITTEQGITNSNLKTLSHHAAMTAHLQPNQEYTYNLAFQSKLESTQISLTKSMGLIDQALETI
jgi:flagellar hook-associated protein FlgK